MRKSRTRRILAAVLAVGAVAVFLGASQGTQTDPLVTMSYINEVTAPQILSDVDDRLDQREQALVDRLDASIARYERDMEQKLSGSAGTGTAGTSSAFTVVNVAAGRQLTGATGFEFLLRSGSATAVAASAPGLIDTTGGGTLASGGAVEPNHLYLTTAEGRGLKAVTDLTVLVRGSYTLT